MHHTLSSIRAAAAGPASLHFLQARTPMLAARSFCKMSRTTLSAASVASSCRSVLLTPSLHRLPCAAAVPCDAHHKQSTRSIVLHNSSSKLYTRHLSVQQASSRAGLYTCAGSDSSSGGTTSSAGDGDSSHSSSSSTLRGKIGFVDGGSDRITGINAVVGIGSSCSSEDEDVYYLVDTLKNPSEEHEHEALWVDAPECVNDIAWEEECYPSEFTNTGKWLLVSAAGS